MHQFLAQASDRPLKKELAGAIDRLFIACTCTPDKDYLRLMIEMTGRQYLLDFLQTNGLLVSRHPLEQELIECEEWSLMKMPLDRSECDDCCKYYSENTTMMILHNVHKLRNFGTLMLDIFTFLLYYWRRQLSDQVDPDFKRCIDKAGGTWPCTPLFLEPYTRYFEVPEQITPLRPQILSVFSSLSSVWRK